MLLIFTLALATVSTTLAYNKTVLPQDPNTTLHQQFATVINPVCISLNSRYEKKNDVRKIQHHRTTDYMFSRREQTEASFICGKHLIYQILVKQACLNGHV